MLLGIMYVYVYIYIYIYIYQYFLRKNEIKSYYMSNTLLRNFKKNEMGGVCSMYDETRGAHRVLLGKPEVKRSL